MFYMKIKELTITAMFIAIMIILATVPNLGIITIGPISLTIMHIPVILAALLLGYGQTILIALIFGICSWLVALSRAITPLDTLFTNPLVAILPKLLFGFICATIAKLFKKQQKIQIILTTTIGTLAHTLLVLSALLIASPSLFAYTTINSAVQAWWLLISTIMMSNGLAEIIVAYLIVYPIVIILRKQKLLS